ncbi:hypothetical protein Leryth_012140 [Lithospermum erythrorhizon]|nr:hypothetical protein Leryth_012140 [Lithospermum erythrorhizon]
MASQKQLSTKELDIQMMLAAEAHLGTKNCDFQMERYVFKRRNDGIYIINLGKTYEKLMMAARVIVSIENPQDIIVQSARPYGQRAVLKFAQYTGCHAIAGRHTPGTFTNQLQTSFSEPRLLILTDPRTDHQPIMHPPICLSIWEPEETKEPEEEDAPVLEYGGPEYGGAETWTSGQIPDAQWGAEAVVAPAPGVAVGGDGGWDAAVPPPMPVADAPPATGWA